MEKRISFNQFQQVKSAARMIDPLKRKMVPLEKKIKVLAQEYKDYQTQIDALEAGIVQILGFHVSDLVKKVIEPTGATDKNGRPVMVTKYLPTDIVSYDEQKKQFVITSKEEEKKSVEEEVIEEVEGEDITEEGDDNDDDLLF